MKNRRNSVLTAISSLLVVMSLLLATGCGKQPEPEISEETSSSEIQTVQQTEQVNASATTQPVSGNEIKEENSTDEVQTEEASAQEEVSESVPQTKEEIVEFFNTGANKIKTNASKVTKNYEKRTVNEDKTAIPGALESFAEEMIAKLMGDDTEPIVYATREEIKSEFLVPDQSYVSKLKAEWVDSATCGDKGDTYEIYLKLKDHKNPTAGVGVGAVCDVIEAFEIAEKASFIEEFSAQYYNCEVKATIDKATGNVIHANYKTPLVLSMRVKLFGTHSGTIGFTFEKDYTITY